MIGSMPRKKARKSPAAPDLNALVAGNVFGWKDVGRDDSAKGGALWGRQADKLGRWRRKKVPDYCGGAAGPGGIEERMKRLARLERYFKELSEIAKARGLPAQWASAEQKCRAALKALDLKIE